jgi:hypothetical protein
MHLGIDGGPNAGQFDITTLAPFGHVHMLSGIFHDPVHGQSGVIRYNRQGACFEQSVDGGLTFECILTSSTAGGVLSIGVIGDTNLTGNIDFATHPSGFMVINDTGDASPLTWAVDTLGLSGLWDFPTNGFNALAKCYNETFASANLWTATHNLNTSNVVVQVYNNASPPAQILPDQIVTTNANVVSVRFNVAQAGSVVIMGCIDS